MTGVRRGVPGRDMGRVMAGNAVACRLERKRQDKVVVRFGANGCRGSFSEQG